MSDAAALPRASARVRDLRRAVARQRLCDRAGTDDLVSLGDRTAGPAPNRGRAGRRGSRRSPRRRSGALRSTRCSASISSAAKRLRKSRAKTKRRCACRRRRAARTSRRSPTRSTSRAMRRRALKLAVERRFARSLTSEPLRRLAREASAPPAAPARPSPRCARVAGRSPICGARCATARATTARS